MVERHILLWISRRILPCRHGDGAVESWQVYHSVNVSDSFINHLRPPRPTERCVGAILTLFGAYSFLWGSILMLTAACFNASGLLATRFFLGVTEAAIAPGLTIIISMFYKRKEQPLRHAAWFLGNTCAGLFGGLLNYGIGHMESIAPWKV